MKSATSTLRPHQAPERRTRPAAGVHRGRPARRLPRRKPALRAHAQPGRRARRAAPASRRAARVRRDRLRCGRVAPRASRPRPRAAEPVTRPVAKGPPRDPRQRPRRPGIAEPGGTHEPPGVIRPLRPADVLHLVDVARPSAGEGQALVRVVGRSPRVRSPERGRSGAARCLPAHSRQVRRTDGWRVSRSPWRTCPTSGSARSDHAA